MRAWQASRNGKCGHGSNPAQPSSTRTVTVLVIILLYSYYYYIPAGHGWDEVEGVTGGHEDLPIGPGERGHAMPCTCTTCYIHTIATR